MEGVRGTGTTAQRMVDGDEREISRAASDLRTRSCSVGESQSTKERDRESCCVVVLLVGYVGGCWEASTTETKEGTT